MSWLLNPLQFKLERLKAAETRLIQFAKQYGNRQAHEYDITAIDTSITTKSDYTIHSIKVESKNSQQQRTDDTKNCSTATPLVILHGYMNGGIYFYRNLVGLSRHFDNIHALDLLGWGLSSRPKYEPQLLEDVQDFYVESIEDWRKKNKIEKMILAGHSMGGYFSVAYTERYPQHVERLILLSPVGVPEADREVIKEREKVITSTLRGKIMWNVYNHSFSRYTAGEFFRTLPTSFSKNFFARYMERRVPAITSADERDAVADYLHWNTVLPGSGEYCLNKFLDSNIVAHQPLVRRIPKLQVEHVSLVYGDHDWMDFTGGLRVLEAVAQSNNDNNSAVTLSTSLYKVRQAGHLLMLDNWEGLNAGIVLGAGLMPKSVPATDHLLEEIKLEAATTTLARKSTETDANSEFKQNVKMATSQQ